MLLLVVGFESLVIVLLMGALLYGQPAAAQFDRERLNAYATQVTLMNVPRPTPTPCPLAGTGPTRRC